MLAIIVEWDDSSRRLQVFHRSKMSGGWDGRALSDLDFVEDVVVSSDAAGAAPSLELADRCLCDISGMLLLPSSMDRSLMLRPARGLSFGILRLASDKLVSGSFGRRVDAVGRDLWSFVELGIMTSE